ncbi:hypothetical protein FG386_000724 [Cryptosporidium ryanae]|uniref:uncharacterized protein n=1 Tax=Cryptosporidium ryanae TaxID=515981 RepID=UPI00351A03D7|nr:hypothetical protein FG386_000724 [Cryptosporidium ryanae]
MQMLISEEAKLDENNKLQAKMDAEIGRYSEMYSILGNILRNIRKNPKLFVEITNEELENREFNLKILFDKISNCKKKIMEVSSKRKEDELQKRREMNRNYLLASNSNSGYIVNEDLNEFNESFGFINENTNKLQKVAHVISQEINEQNKIIEDLSLDVENKSKFVYYKEYFDYFLN